MLALTSKYGIANHDTQCTTVREAREVLACWCMEILVPHGDYLVYFF